MKPLIRQTAMLSAVLLGLLLLSSGSAPAFEIRDREFQSYVMECTDRIQRNWCSLPLGKSPASVLVVIRPDGRLALLRLAVSSSSRSVDEAALAAVRRSAPFQSQPLPHDPNRCLALLIKFSNDLLMHRYRKSVSAWIEDADARLSVSVVNGEWMERQRKTIDDFLKGSCDGLSGVDVMPERESP